MGLDYGEITEDLVKETVPVSAFIKALKVYTATPKADRKYADLCDVLGIDRAGFLGAQLAMIDTVEEQAAD